MSKSNSKQKSGLFARLTDPAFLSQAWSDVLRHYSKERVPDALREFDRRRAARIDSLSVRLRDQTFIPQPASLIFIPKANHPNERRPITLIEPEDRIVLTGLNLLLSPIVDRFLLDGCYAYRRQRGAGAAIAAVHEAVKRGSVHAAAGDIDDFFANLDRERLFGTLKRRLWDAQILNLLETYLFIGATRQLDWVDSGRGVAQGSPLSPALSNLYLADLDQLLESTGLDWFRYADNILVLGREGDPVRAAWAKVEEHLANKCKLRFNPESRVATTTADGFEFLGFWFKGLLRMIAPSKMDQKRAALATAMKANKGDLGALVADLSETMKGWRNYYGAVADTKPQLETLLKHFEDLFVPWLQAWRGQGGSGKTSAELKAALLPIELPMAMDARRKLKWVELQISRSRPAKKAQHDKDEPPWVSEKARHAVHERKKELAERKQALEELAITKPGTYLGRTGGRILVRRDGKRETEIPMSLVRGVTFFTTAFTVSGEFLVEASSHGIAVMVAGRDGRPAVRIGPPDLPGHELSLAQSALAASTGGLDLARTIVAGKIRNQVNLLKYFLKYPERRAEKDYLAVTTRAVKEMQGVEEEVLKRKFGDDHDLERGRLFAAEGQAAGQYWAAVRALLPWKPGFERRVHRGAGDLVNSLLNYGYGIMYSRLFTVLAKTGLNMNVGFLHKPQPGKSGLLYDFIEEFRAAAVDRSVFALLNLAAGLEVGKDGLTADTRHLLAAKVIERLQTPTRYHGESVALQKVIELQAELLVRHIQGKERYRTFVLPW